MNKLKIDFTAEEKKKLRKGKIGLRRLDEYSLNQIIKVVDVNIERQSEIKEQFYRYLNDQNGTLGTGLLAERMQGLSYPLRNILLGNDRLFEIANRSTRMSDLAIGNSFRKTIEKLDDMAKLGESVNHRLSTHDTLSSLMSATRLGAFANSKEANVMAAFIPVSERINSFNDKSVSGALNALNAFRPISERLQQLSIRDRSFTATLGVFERYRPTSERLTLSALSSAPFEGLMKNYRSINPLKTASGFSRIASSLDGLIGIKRNETLAHSLLQDVNFRKLGIIDLAQQLISKSAFEKTHMTGVGSALKSTTFLTGLAQSNLGKFNWGDLGHRASISQSLIGRTQSNFLALSSGYSEVLRSINLKPNWIYDAPEVAKLPALNYYATSKLLKIVSIEEEETQEVTSDDSLIAEESQDAIDRYLPQLAPGLKDMWFGALEALSSDNRDKIRHFITSLRELYNHVLHILAPDCMVDAWDKERQYYFDGRPTRRGRFLYICRNIEGSESEYSKLLKLEIDSTLSLITLFQGGTHAIKSNFKENELQFIRIKSENALRTFLQIEFDFNRRN
jgi:hypothetical protein